MADRDHQQPQNDTRRPRVLNSLDSIDGVQTFCKMPNGEPVFIPLRLIFVAFERDMINKMRVRGGQPWQ